MQPHGRANFSRDGARFGFLNAKMHNFLRFTFFGPFGIFWGVWLIFFAQNFLPEILTAQKKSTFRKSGQQLANVVKATRIFNRRHSYRPSTGDLIRRKTPCLLGHSITLLLVSQADFLKVNLFARPEFLLDSFAQTKQGKTPSKH